MSAAAKALDNLYRRNKINKNGLKKAVTDNVITSDEYEKITGEKLV